MRAILDDNLCYPVAITLGNGGFGSGFFLNSPTEIYLVTAKHCLYDQFDKLLDAKATGVAIANDLTTKITFKLNLALLESDGNIKPHPTADVVVAKIGKLATSKALQFTAGVVPDGTIPSGARILGMSCDACRKFDDVLVANDVYVFGYPVSIGEAGQLDLNRPLLRKGIVADKDPDKQHIVIDCPLYQGNSGGLVIEVQQVNPAQRNANAIGVATAFVPFVEKLKNLNYGMINTRYENSGYAIVTPIDRVLELI